MKNIHNYFFQEGTKISNIVESSFSENEIIVWKSRPKKIAYIIRNSFSLFLQGIIFAILLFDLTYLIISKKLFSLNVLLISTPFFIIFISLFVKSISIFIKRFIEAKYLFYVITNERILVLKGKEKYIYDFIKIDEISDISLKENLIDKILKTGNIIIKDNEKELIFNNIPECIFIYNKINEFKNKENKKEGFYKNRVECLHCGIYYDKNNVRCPSCGSPNRTE